MSQKTEKTKNPEKAPQLPKHGDHVRLVITRRKTHGQTYAGTMVQRVKVEGIKHAFYLQPDGLPEPTQRLLCLWVQNYGGREATWVLNTEGHLYVVDKFDITPATE